MTAPALSFGTSFDDLYESQSTFDEVYSAIVERKLPKIDTTL